MATPLGAKHLALAVVALALFPLAFPQLAGFATADAPSAPEVGARPRSCAASPCASNPVPPADEEERP